MKTMKAMPEVSRPREKLREKGAPALTDEELVAAILGIGTAGVDVRTIARQVSGHAPGGRWWPAAAQPRAVRQFRFFACAWFLQYNRSSSLPTLISVMR